MSDPQKSIIYCDARPDFGSGGFDAVLGAIFHADLPPPPVTLISALKAQAGDRDGNAYLGLLSFKGSRLPFAIRLALLAYDLLKTLLSRRLAPFAGAADLCIWVGNDWTALVRGMGVAWRLKIDGPTIYVVDDIYQSTGASSAGAQKLRNALIRFLARRVRARFAITPALAEEFRVQSGLEWTPLDLPYRLDELVALPAQNAEAKSAPPSWGRPTELVFIGAIASAILPALEELCDLLVRRQRSDPAGQPSILLHIVTRDPGVLSGRIFEQCRKMGALKIHLSLSDDEVTALFDQDAVFLCPYSSQAGTRHLVSTSFPSKILKMVSYRRHIVIVAPDDAAVRRSHGAYFPSISDTDIQHCLADLGRLARSKKPWTDPELLRRHSLKAYFDALKPR